MIKRTAALLLALMLIGCAGAQNQQAAGQDSTEQTAGAGGTEISAKEAAQQNADGTAADSGAEAGKETAGGTAAQEAKEDEVTIVIPKMYESITTQEEADEICRKNGYKKAVLKEDGSLEITMTRSQQQELIADFKKSVDQGIQQITESENYPSVSKIEYNEDYSVFTVVTDEEEIGITERQLAQELIMYGTIYHVYSGEETGTIRVDFVNKETGEVIESAESGNPSDQD